MSGGRVPLGPQMSAVLLIAVFVVSVVFDLIGMLPGSPVHDVLIVCPYRANGAGALPDSHVDSHGGDTWCHVVEPVDGQRAQDGRQMARHNVMDAGRRDF